LGSARTVHVDNCTRCDRERYETVIVSLLPAATLDDGRVLVGRVRCRVSCRARVTVDDDRTGAGPLISGRSRLP
jgi:hypothetical protein